LVILDGHMPDMDGFAVAEEIAKRRQHVPTVMMLTSGGQRGDGARCRALGIGAYLTKPVRQSDLLKAIRLALGAGEAARSGALLITRHSLAEGASASPRNAERSLRVLVAEDNLVNQQLVTRLLDKRGHSVLVVGNGREAVAAYEREPFDLILMDVQMPEMGGFEATAALRASHGNGHPRPPIIAMTARAMKGDREACLAAGMDGYIAKPVSPKALYDEIEAHVPAVRSQNAAPALDGNTLLERFDGDRQLLGELAQIFLEDCPARLSAIEIGLERSDPMALVDAAHALRGSAGNFGALQAVEAALKLELMGMARDLTGAPAAFLDLQRAITALTSELGTVTRQRAP
jgi:CheY-like chemotaxis protein